MPKPQLLLLLLLLLPLLLVVLLLVNVTVEVVYYIPVRAYILPFISRDMEDESSNDDISSYLFLVLCLQLCTAER